MTSRRPGTAFTFVELLIAATMTAILFVGLGAHLRGGLTVWRHAHVSMDRLQQRRVAFERLERDLANAVIYDSRPEAYGTEPGQLPAPEFASGSLAWFTAMPPTADAAARIQMVGYACDTLDGEPGFWRLSWTIPEARAARPPKRQRLLPECGALEIRYAHLPASLAGPLEWRAEWRDAAQDFPRLLDVSIRFASGEELRRLYAVPIGVLKPAEAPAS